MNDDDFLAMPNWYPVLAEHSLPARFMRLRQEASEHLAASDEVRMSTDRELIKSTIAELKSLMGSGRYFVSVDTCSPTDTSRFAAKRGAVHSAASAWRYLCASEKVRQAARDGKVKYLCIRPFRTMNLPREFRLFVRDRRLAGMSQYNLIRHYFRLDRQLDKYWRKAAEFVDDIAWKLPLSDLVIDVYITSDWRVLVIDLNCWGEPTDPLLLRRWDRDWDTPTGLLVMPKPCRLNGEVNVSF